MEKLNEKVDYNEQKVKELIESLVMKQIINENEAKSINVNKILKYTNSKIFKELKHAKEVYKEKPFYINILQEGENVLIQGIIDLYYINENNELTLVDYKTDYVENGNEQELINKYFSQLSMYRQALENALDREVNNVYIYSVYLEKVIKLEM